MAARLLDGGLIGCGGAPPAEYPRHGRDRGRCPEERTQSPACWKRSASARGVRYHASTVNVVALTAICAFASSGAGTIRAARARPEKSASAVGQLGNNFARLTRTR